MRLRREVAKIGLRWRRSSGGCGLGVKRALFVFYKLLVRARGGLYRSTAAVG
jgi:hypothetical protein